MVGRDFRMRYPHVGRGEHYRRYVTAHRYLKGPPRSAIHLRLPRLRMMGVGCGWLIAPLLVLGLVMICILTSCVLFMTPYG